ncbi:EAL domain-containing protein [bacterium]|nr:EAL domain-containing protein [bacterium]MCI0607128.1 EAL domain-containing protein [bacterium]
MAELLRVLIVEDSEDDAVLLLRDLRHAGYDPHFERVETAEAMEAALDIKTWDLVVADYSMPHFSAPAALALLQKKGFDLPFLILSGNIGEDIAVAAMKAGAHDYIMKGNRARLLPAIQRELHEATERRTRRQAQQNAHEMERRFREMLENVKMISVLLDQKGNITFCNEFLLKLTGYRKEDVLGQNWFRTFVPEDGREETESMFLQKIEEGSILPHDENEIQTLSGERKLILWSNTILRNSAGKIIGTASMGADITEKKHMEESLRETEERYALAVEGANDGLWDWNLKTNGIYYSPRWKAMIGYTELEISSNPEEWFGRVHPEDVEKLRENISRHLEGLTPHLENEHRIIHKDETYRWMLSRGLAVRNTYGKPYRMAGSQTDITDRKRAEEQLLHDAFHDSLTGLPNRALFLDRLGGVITRAAAHAKRRKDYLFAVLFLDLDRFKVVNDSLGHTIGDRLLVALSHRLLSLLRPGDTVARLGGDEFAILLDDIKDISDATRIADRIQKELTLPFHLEGHEVFTTASIGIALSGTQDNRARDTLLDAETLILGSEQREFLGVASAPAVSGVIAYDHPEDLLRDADTAMYRAKALGKARYEMFDQAMHARILSLLVLETDLRRAFDRKEILVYYQPILSLESGRIMGFEALARWQHVHRGLIEPTDFIPLAEETGLILPLGEQVLRKACRQLKQWQKQFNGYPPLYMSVNVSVKQFSQPHLIEMIDQILQETKLEPNCLRLEITESLIMENPESVTSMLFLLRSLGVQLTIDDFGTGYSSLSCLHRFPINTLKIDKSFVAGMSSDTENVEIVKTITTLAHHLQMDVVAEGVESEMQVLQLRSLRCEAAQGFYFSHPLDTEDARKFLEMQRK